MFSCYKRVVCSGRMTPHSLATASGLLLGLLALAMGVGALLGAAFGSWRSGC